jgi:hypothetical protein
VRGSNLLCDPYCGDATAAAGWGVPFWAILLLIILLALLLATFATPKKDPPTLKKAVDDVLAGFQTQAQTWGDREAESAFASARAKVAAEIEKYRDLRRLN